MQMIQMFRNKVRYSSSTLMTTNNILESVSINIILV